MRESGATATGGRWAMARCEPGPGHRGTRPANADRPRHPGRVRPGTECLRVGRLGRGAGRRRGSRSRSGWRAPPGDGSGRMLRILRGACGRARPARRAVGLRRISDPRPGPVRREPFAGDGPTPTDCGGPVGNVGRSRRGRPGAGGLRLLHLAAARIRCTIAPADRTQSAMLPTRGQAAAGLDAVGARSPMVAAARSGPQCGVRPSPGESLLERVLLASDSAPDAAVHQAKYRKVKNSRNLGGTSRVNSVLTRVGFLPGSLAVMAFTLPPARPVSPTAPYHPASPHESPSNAGFRLEPAAAIIDGR
jgi:hypothetical protein